MSGQNKQLYTKFVKYKTLQRIPCVGVNLEGEIPKACTEIL